MTQAVQEKTNTAEPKFKCPICNKELKNKFCYDGHLRSHKTEVKESTTLLPPQKINNKKTKFVKAFIVRNTGIYLEKKFNPDSVPVDVMLWRYQGDYVYSLMEINGKYEPFEPTGASSMLPETLWRAKTAAPIRKVFSYKSSFHEKLNLGLGIAFVIVCIFVLFVLAKG